MDEPLYLATWLTPTLKETTITDETSSHNQPRYHAAAMKLENRALLWREVKEEAWESFRLEFSQSDSLGDR